MSTSISQSVVFDASPHAVYEAFMDSTLHAAFTHSPARVSREVGGEYLAYDGYITGKNVELVPDLKIVQTWQASDWPADHFSVVTILLTTQAGGTRLDLTHADLPGGTEEEFRRGWIDNYWEPLRAFLKG